MTSQRMGQQPVANCPVVPANRFVGVVQANGLNARVTSLACTSAGEIVVLTMVGPRTAVSAIAATLHKGGRVRHGVQFTPERAEAWRGPRQLTRIGGAGSRWMASEVAPTTHLDVAVVAQEANIAYCREYPIAWPAPSVAQPEVGSGRASRSRPRRQPLPPARYVLASEGAAHPDMLTFLGMMRSLWLPFPPSFAPLMWEAGLAAPLELAEDESFSENEGEHTLIEPVAHCLGIAAWQLLPAKQWQTVLEHVALQASARGL